MAAPKRKRVKKVNSRKKVIRFVRIKTVNRSQDVLIF